MKMTKMISTVAVIALMGSSALYAAPGPGEMPVYIDRTGNTWSGLNALDNFISSASDAGGNTVFGHNAGLILDDAETSASYNTFVGLNTGLANIVGGFNTFVGADAGAENTSDANTMIGTLAGASNITGLKNIFLGYTAGANETGSYKLYIDSNNTMSPLIYGEFDNDMLRVNGTLDVNGTAWTKDVIVNGSLHVYGTVVTPLVVDSTIENNDTITSKLNADDTSNFHRLLVLDVNNTGGGNSNVGFSLINSEEGEEFEWTFRTYAATKGFAASKIDTGGTEFRVSNESTNPDDGYEDVVVEMGGVVVFKDGSLVDGTGTPLASLVQEQDIKLAAQDKLLTETMAKMEAKDAELIAMKADYAMKLTAQNDKIAQLETMQQKVAMMESILTNLALNVSDADKSKLSINLK